MGCYVLGFQEIDQTQVAVVGGKGAHLGELSRIEGLRVPAGFCVTTDAFQRIMAEAPSIDDRLDRLSRLKPDDREAIRALSADIRRILEGIAIPDDLAAAITCSLARLGDEAAYAVRSSATAEDLPTVVTLQRAAKPKMSAADYVRAGVSKAYDRSRARTCAASPHRARVGVCVAAAAERLGIRPHARPRRPSLAFAARLRHRCVCERRDRARNPSTSSASAR